MNSYKYSKKERSRRHKWLKTYMHLIIELPEFRLFCEEKIITGCDLIKDYFLKACDFVSIFFPDKPQFNIRLYATRESFSKAAERNIEPGWMGTPIKDNISIIVLSLETMKETNNTKIFRSHIVHEVSHIYLYQSVLNSEKSLPAWLDEGICQWIEAKFRQEIYNETNFTGNHIKIYSDLKNTGINIPISSMNSDLCLLDEPDKYIYGPKARYAYSKSYLTILYLIAGYGEKEFLKKIHQKADGSELNLWLNSLIEKGLDKEIDLYHNIYI